MMESKILDDLKKLKNVFYKTLEIDLGAIKVTIKPLSSEEEIDAHSMASTYEQGIAYLFAVKRETVLRSIIGLNGNSLDEIIEEGEAKLQRHLWLKRNIVSGWTQKVIDRLWDDYLILLDDVNKNIEKNIVEEVIPEPNKE